MDRKSKRGNHGRDFDASYDQDYARSRDGYGRWREDEPSQHRSEGHTSRDKPVDVSGSGRDQKHP